MTFLNLRQALNTYSASASVSVEGSTSSSVDVSLATDYHQSNNGHWCIIAFAIASFNNSYPPGRSLKSSAYSPKRRSIATLLLTAWRTRPVAFKRSILPLQLHRPSSCSNTRCKGFASVIKAQQRRSSFALAESLLFVHAREEIGYVLVAYDVSYCAQACDQT